MFSIALRPASLGEDDGIPLEYIDHSIVQVTRLPITLMHDCHNGYLASKVLCRCITRRPEQLLDLDTYAWRMYLGGLPSGRFRRRRGIYCSQQKNRQHSIVARRSTDDLLFAKLMIAIARVEREDAVKVAQAMRNTYSMEPERGTLVKAWRWILDKLPTEIRPASSSEDTEASLKELDSSVVQRARPTITLTHGFVATMGYLAYE